MNRRPLFIALGVLVAVSAAWYFLVIKPVSSDVTELKDNVAIAKAEGQEQRVRLGRLENLRNAAGTATDINRVIDQLVPAQADLANFLNAATSIQYDTGVDWLSISPAPPAANPAGGPSVIGLSISIEGTFYDLLQYLDALQDPKQMPRLVVVEGLSISAAGGAETAAAGVSPTLSVSLSAKMFTRSPAAGLGGAASGSTAAPGATTPGTSTSSPGASTSSPGASTPATAVPPASSSSSTSSGAAPS